MSLQIDHFGDATLVRVHDSGECAVLGRLAAHLHEADGSTLVIDVSAMTVTPGEGVDLLVRRVRRAALADSRSRWAFVASRLTARRVLARMCAGSRIEVYGNVDDALGVGTESNDAGGGAGAVGGSCDLPDEIRGLTANDAGAKFVIVTDAIPVAVRCGACGRLHSPHRVPVVAAAEIRRPGCAEEGRTVVALRCPRCDARGILDVAHEPGSTEETIVDALMQRPEAAEVR